MRRRAAWALLVVVAVGCGGSGRGHRTDPAAALRRVRERPHHGQAAAGTGRAAILAALRHSVLTDARRRARARELRGPFVGASCSVARDDRAYARAHPSAPVLRYECVAVTSRSTTEPPMILGTPFIARVDFAAGRYAWCRFTPVGGEGAHSAATFAVPPAPACARR